MARKKSLDDDQVATPARAEVITAAAKRWKALMKQ